MVKVKNIIGSDANIEDQVNKFLEQCDEKGFVVRNITFIYFLEQCDEKGFVVRNITFIYAEQYDSFNVFVEYETFDNKEEN